MREDASTGLCGAAAEGVEDQGYGGEEAGLHVALLIWRREDGVESGGRRAEVEMGGVKLFKMRIPCLSFRDAERYWANYIYAE